MTKPVPHFVIAGTQKAGTTWLKQQLARHPDVFMARKQLHFFDRNFHKGIGWYKSWFRSAAPEKICGEKTTEYFDIPTAAPFAQYVANFFPQLKVIIILRDPVTRALSALRHMVNSGLEKLPTDPDRVLFDDKARPRLRSFRYIERGFYANQLKDLYRNIPTDQIMVLVFEEDIIDNPSSCLRRVCDFIGVPNIRFHGYDRPVNRLRLSPLAIALSYQMYDVPYARSVIRRADRVLGLNPWKPEFKLKTVARLRSIFADHNAELFQLLGREITAWGHP